MLIFDSKMPRGDDVGCNTSLGEIVITHYATRYPQRYSAAFLAEDAGLAIKERWPTATPYEGTVATVGGDEENPPTSAVRFLVVQESSRRYTHAFTAEIGPWSFKQRLTAPADSALAAQTVGSDTWNIILRLARTNPGKDEI